MNIFLRNSDTQETPISRRDNYLAKDILLNEASNPAYVRRTIQLVGAGIILFLIWSSLAKVDVVTRAQGQVSPLASVQVVQHLDGGRIAAIKVSDGSKVRRGQVLLALDDREARLDLATTRARYWALYARNERLRAFVTGGAPNFAPIPDEFRKFAAQEAMILSVARNSRSNEVAVVRSQLGQVSSELGVVSELSQIRRDLAEEKLVSRTSYLDAMRVQKQLEGQRRTLNDQALAVSSSRARDAADEISRTETELAQLDEQVKKLEVAVARAQIVAPMDGFVQGLRYRTIGGVISPGGEVMNIIPADGKIEGEVRVPATEVGHLRVGQSVRVKVATYDFLRYGTLTGKVTSIAPNSSVTDKGDVYFLTKVSFDRSSESAGLSNKSLISGMTIETDIVTDRQSVLHYLLAPIFRAVEGAFGER